MNNLTAVDWAWIGGFFDGEGTFGIARKRPNAKHKEQSILYQPQVKVSVTDERPIKWLKENVGGNYYCYDSKSSKWKDYYRWETYGDSIVEFIKHVSPYLRIKKEVSDVVLDLQLRVSSYPFRQRRNKGKKGYLPMDVSELKERQKLYEKARLLNKRGR